ncbi:MAG: hypothetical protein P4L31_05765 [Candidatus Babeliales bacterium]|nr:hypothetical protein [Candidatus Babeliales bacterium]
MKNVGYSDNELSGSSIYFKDNKVLQANNDGMELLGHFLVDEVGKDKARQFSVWLIDSEDDVMSAGPYFLEKIGDEVSIDHLENERMMPFLSSKKSLLDVLKQWHELCNGDADSVCTIGGGDVTLSKSADGQGFVFHKHQVH